MARVTKSKGKKAGATKGGKRPSRAKKPARVLGNYAGALKYLAEHTDVERIRASRVGPGTFDLDRMRALAAALGSPEQELRCVHVAGTNGKGSVIAMLESCLRECGYAVGVYTSPHLVDVRERIQINGAPVSHAAFVAALGKVAEAADGLPKRHGPPTYFELLTATGFLHFAEQAVDIALIEVGLGGRLDATNIITPEISAITAIAEDHTQFLGETLPEIAREKAGIVKASVPAVTIKQDPGAEEAMREVAAAVDAPFEVLGSEIDFSYRFEASPQLGPHTRVGLSTTRNVYEHVPVPLAGEHQALNCGLALAILDRLGGLGFDLPEPKVIEGLAKTTVPGRMEFAWREPRILLDGAHNPSSIGALMKSIGAHVPYDSMVVVFGCAADKDVDEMLKRVALGADKVIFTRARGNPRASDPDELARRFAAQSGKMWQVAPTLDEALSIAARAAGRDDLVCVTGSFYLVGEAKRWLTLRADRAAAAAGA